MNYRAALGPIDVVNAGHPPQFWSNQEGFLEEETLELKMER